LYYIKISVLLLHTRTVPCKPSSRFAVTTVTFYYFLWLHLSWFSMFVAVVDSYTILFWLWPTVWSIFDM